MILVKKKFSFLILCFYCFFIYPVVGSEDYTEIKDKANLPILTPSFAKTTRAKIKLKNGLEAYLVSDPNADQSGAVLTVKAGSWDEPAEYPGIAHFLEHMLFLGTKKYPHESEYDRYIKENGGSNNAYTSNDYTCFLFSINNSAFELALDRFSDFFKEPLFNPSGVSRELHAIDQEFAQNIEKDEVREIFVLKDLANPEHAYHRFNIGNSNTLSKVSQETLKEWYHTHYSANLMRLMIISPLPMTQLKKIVVDDFSEIPNYNKVSSPQTLPIFDPNSPPSIAYIEPIKNIRWLNIVWDIPKDMSTQESKPDSLICYVLGHEGNESLLAQLKREGLAEGISCGTSWLGSNNQEIYLNVELTDLGIHQLDTVIERVFQTLAILRQKGIPEYLFQELQQLNKIQYQYPQREDAFNLMFKYSQWLAREEMATFPLYSQVIQKYDPKAIQSLLDFLTPANAHINVLAPSSITGIKTDRKEPWLGVNYTLQPILPERQKKWMEAIPHPNINLPAHNPFIPEQLSLVQVSLKEPQEGLYQPKPLLVVNNLHAKIFFASDNKFQQPKISWLFEIKTPAIDNGIAESVVSADLFVKNAIESLTTITYPAIMGGLNFSIDRSENGLSLSIEGYSEKAPLLLDTILKKLNEPMTEENFKKFKDILFREYQNSFKDSSLSQASEFFKEIIYEKYPSNKAKINALRRLSLKKYSEFFQGLFKKNFVQGMMFGNLTEKEAKEIAISFYTILKGDPYPIAEQQPIEVIVLPNDKGPFYIEKKVDVQGNAALLGIENPEFDFKKRAAQQIFMQAIDEPFFAQLRTKQQTGYIVGIAADEVEKQLFDLFAVQSNTHDPRDLLARFELFIEGYLQEIQKELPPERFEIFKNALTLKVETSAKNIKEMGDLLYRIAFKYDANFNWVEERIKGFKDLDYSTFLTLSREFVGKSNKRRLGILIKGNLPEENQFSYTRLALPSKLRAISSFTTYTQKTMP